MIYQYPATHCKIAYDSVSKLIWAAVIPPLAVLLPQDSGSRRTSALLGLLVLEGMQVTFQPLWPAAAPR